MDEYSALEFLKQVLSIPSVNGVDDEGRVAEFLCEYLRACHVESSVQRIDATHANVVAILPGESEKVVIWNGHLDTVPYGDFDEWTHLPYEVHDEGGLLFVRGASDMKSGLAAMVYTLGQMKKAHRIPRDTIYFLGTCDEEKNGLGARKALEKEFVKEADLLFIGEPTGCKLGVAQKGCMWIALLVEGITSHGAYPKEGINAIEYGMDVCGQFKKYITQFFHPVLGNATAQVTMIHGGITPNMTPDRAEILMDIRVVPGISSDDIITKLKEICHTYKSKSNNKVKFEIEVRNDRIAIEINSNNYWVKACKKVLKNLAIPSEEIGINYFTDGSILSKAVQMPVLLLGPGNPNMAHKPDEYVEKSKYLEYLEILQNVFWRN